MEYKAYVTMEIDKETFEPIVIANFEKLNFKIKFTKTELENNSIEELLLNHPKIVKKIKSIRLKKLNRINEI